MNPIELEQKPDRCPKCGGRIVPIVYGEPTPETGERAERKEVILGGCCLMEDDEGNLLSPQWGCVKCGREYFVEEK